MVLPVFHQNSSAIIGSFSQALETKSLLSKKKSSEGFKDEKKIALIDFNKRLKVKKRLEKLHRHNFLAEETNLFIWSFGSRRPSWLDGKFVEFYFSTIASEATQAASEAQRPPLMRPRTQKMLLKARMSLNNDAFDGFFSQELTRF